MHQLTYLFCYYTVTFPKDLTKYRRDIFIFSCYIKTFHEDLAMHRTPRCSVFTLSIPTARPEQTVQIQVNLPIQFGKGKSEAV